MLNIKKFEKNITSTIINFYLIAVFITSILFAAISYQTNQESKNFRSHNIESTISLFRSNLSEKLAIIANSTTFTDFLTSGSSTRKKLQAKFLTELLPLHTSGVTGFALSNIETGMLFKEGIETKTNLTFKLCYLANKLDNNGNCYGKITLYFSSEILINELTHINNKIESCVTCQKYSLSKNNHFGSFLVLTQNNFKVGLTATESKINLLFYYLITVLGLSLIYYINKIKFKKIIKQAITNPLSTIVNNIKNQTLTKIDPGGLSEITYLYRQIKKDRNLLKENNEMDKQAACGGLAASVAHDIASPLAVMQIITSQYENVIPQEQASILDSAIASVRHISNNLLHHHRNLDNK